MHLTNQEIVAKLISYSQELREHYELYQLLLFHFQEKQAEQFFGLIEEILNSVNPIFQTVFKTFLKNKDKIVNVQELSYLNAKLEATNNLIRSLNGMLLVSEGDSYIHAGLLKVKTIDLPRAVRLKAKKAITKKRPGKFIEERPETINARGDFGDWEIDLVLGAKTKNEPVILTLVERQTRYALTYKIENKLSETVHQTVEQLVEDFPSRSITADNGSEFSRLADIKGIDVYFARPYSSHERGTNENFNGLLRGCLKSLENVILVLINNTKTKTKIDVIIES